MTTPRTDKAARSADFPLESLLESQRLETELTLEIEKTRRLEVAIRATIEENLDLADGENCTLARLKKAIGFE